MNSAQRTPDGVFLLRMGEELRLKRVQHVAGGAPLHGRESLFAREEMLLGVVVSQARRYLV